MGGAGMPDLGNMDLSQMLGGGLKGKVGSFAMKHAMKRQANKMKKAKKNVNKKGLGLMALVFYGILTSRDIHCNILVYIQ